MKIYFGFTVAGDRSGIEIARKVVDQLEEMGHEVLTRHLVSDNAWEADRLISPQEVYRRDMTWLEQCELFIAEVSGSPGFAGLYQVNIQVPAGVSPSDTVSLVIKAADAQTGAVAQSSPVTIIVQ